MTAEEIKIRISEIQRLADVGKDVKAYIDEYDLMMSFIRFASTQDGKLGSMASLILTTNSINFSRAQCCEREWYE